MFLKKITIILTSFLFITSSAQAQTTTSTSGKFTILNKGDPAPFDGTLFDPAAIAKVIADKKYAAKDCSLRIKYEKDLGNARCIRDTKLLKSELEIEKKKYNLIVSAQKEEIEVLRNLATGQNNTLWATIGFALGAVTSIAIFYAAKEVSN